MSEGPEPAAAYAVGIDLGTTHCALSYVDLDLSEGEDVAHYVLPIPQVVSPGEIEARELLPSFLYLPHADELRTSDLSLPWAAAPGYGAGELARALGAKTPMRLVSSAKSWLSHAGVDRRGAILPIGVGEGEVARVSPLEASARYLRHLRAAWEHKHPEAPFTEQPVVLTVPASFDPAARELTAEAAREAGYAHLTLLEEPQAALYAWIGGRGAAWRDDLRIGDLILVVDVGGGTTDFSLIAAREEDGAVALHRVAVGDHILLGGDNMDLALAHLVRGKLESEGPRLDEWQARALVHGCRAAKEALLGDEDLTEHPIVVPSRGSKLVGGSLRTALTRDETSRVILEGFFPRVEAGARPEARARAGLTQLGLPYAHDAGITRHLSAFLGRQASALGQAQGALARPTAILFNGGVFKSSLLVDRVVGLVDAWLASEGAAPVRVLGGADLDLACARGAAYYAFVRRGGGVRIRGGTAKSYYVGVEASVPAVPGMQPPLAAVCVAPFGMEEGSDAEAIPHELGLVVGEPVRFRFFGSSVRRDDRVGTTVERWVEGELEELEELEATLTAAQRVPGEVVPVRLRASVTEVGTLRIEAIARGEAERWNVELDTRGADVAAAL